MATEKKTTGKINKMEAVRQVITAHGKDTMPLEIVHYVKEEHALEMSPDMASTYKSTALKQLGLASGGKGKRGPKPGRKAAAAPAANGAEPAPKSHKAGGISMDDIRAVKALAARIGADKVRQLAEVLA